MDIGNILQSFHVIPLIVAFAYIIAEVLKKFILKTDNQKTMLPIICGCLGGISGLIIFYTCPTYLDPSTTGVLNAIADGAFSGIMATGCNQIYKQIKKFLTPTDSEES